VVRLVHAFSFQSYLYRLQVSVYIMHGEKIERRSFMYDPELHLVLDLLVGVHYDVLLYLK